MSLLGSTNVCYRDKEKNKAEDEQLKHNCTDTAVQTGLKGNVNTINVPSLGSGGSLFSSGDAPPLSWQSPQTKKIPRPCHFLLLLRQRQKKWFFFFTSSPGDAISWNIEGRPATGLWNVIEMPFWNVVEDIWAVSEDLLSDFSFVFLLGSDQPGTVTICNESSLYIGFALQWNHFTMFSP